jgi:hypothetical protein
VRAEHGAKLQAALEDAVAPALKAQLRLLAAEQLAGFDKDLKVGCVCGGGGVCVQPLRRRVQRRSGWAVA